MVRAGVVFLEDRVMDDGGGHRSADSKQQTWGIANSRQQTANSQLTAGSNQHSVDLPSDSLIAAGCLLFTVCCLLSRCLDLSLTPGPSDPKTYGLVLQNEPDPKQPPRKLLIPASFLRSRIGRL